MSTIRTSVHSQGLRIVGNDLQPMETLKSTPYTPYIATQNRLTVTGAFPSYSALPYNFFVLSKIQKNKEHA